MKKIFVILVHFVLFWQISRGQVRIHKPVNSNNTSSTLQNPVQNEGVKILRPAQTYDFSHIRICIDRPPSQNLPPRNEAEIFRIPRVAKDGSLVYPNNLQQGLTSVTATMWDPGDVLTVGFYKSETTANVIEKVKQIVGQWLQYANIKFLYLENVGTANIRVGFGAGESWSYIGRDALNIPAYQRTVNFGWLSDTLNFLDFQSVVLHEFGHVLGFIHEHSSPLAAIPWDKEKVYAYFGGEPNNWSRGKVDSNVFWKYSLTETNFSGYDRMSIMHYFFPRELTQNQMVFSQNYILSGTDIRYAGVFYPFPVNPTGTLYTGDDCDEIDFLIEYGVVDKSLAEFVLQPGIDKAGNRVSWWKQIGIPVTGGARINLELAPDGKTDRKPIAMIILDKSRKFSFAKAKVFGVHTGLGYQWDILPAVIGGCRVTLTWRNDHCY